MTDLPLHADVVIVGAGPAGLAAATELRTRGVASVVVLDREPQAGGIPRHCNHFPYGLREFRRLLRGPAYAAHLVETAKAAGVQIHTEVTVTRLLEGPALQLTTPGGLREISARHVLLCTGVRETSRAARLIGGVKPGGVVSTGALQGMVYLDGLRPFRRPVVLGTELVSFSALMTCRHLGIRPVAMIEPAGRTTARWPTGLFPRVQGIPLMLNTELLAIEGRDQVTGIMVRGADGQTQRIETDGVIVSGHFRPESSLLRTSHLDVDQGSGGAEIDQFGRCSDPGYFAAGNLLRPVETAGWSWKEGRAVGRAMAQSLAGQLPPPEPAAVVKPSGDALKLIVPQRIVPSDTEPALPRFQLRVNRAVKGRLLVSAKGAVLFSTAINALPERRITVPLTIIPAGASGPIDINVKEDPA
ncbi:MAG: FAD-dependent oxidoreductase [Rhizobiaceae bacterium]|nr:FAD-dependent oxidoreductase [Rhizobiaceae bacterium]